MVITDSNSNSEPISAFLSCGIFQLVVEKSLNFIAQFLYEHCTGEGKSVYSSSYLLIACHCIIVFIEDFKFD